MLVSTKGRYALRLMTRIAKAGPGGKVSLREISETEDISLKYLEQIARPLLRVGLIESVRGKGGGYRLVHPSDMVKAGDVLRAVEGTTVPVTCAALSGEGECPRSGVCTTVGFWSGLDQAIESYVDGVTLADLAQGYALDEALGVA